MIKFIPKTLEGNVNVPEDNHLLELVRLLGGVFLLLIVGFIAIGLFTDILVPFIPPSVEYALAKDISKQFTVDKKHQADNKRLERILGRLQAQRTSDQYPCHVFLVESPIVNAGALPGGTIMMNTALYDVLNSDNEIAFVLAHELGHYAHRDHLRGFGRSLLMQSAFAILFGDNSALSGLSQSSGALMMAQYSQGQETSADEYALDVLNRSEHHVEGAMSVFKTFNQLEKEKNDNSTSLPFLASHPPTDERLKRLIQVIQQQHYSL